MDDEEIEYAQEHDPRWGLVGGWADQVEDTVDRVEAMYDRDPQLIQDALDQGVTPGEMPQEYFEPPIESYGNEEFQQSYGEQSYGQAYEEPTYEEPAPAWEPEFGDPNDPWAGNGDVEGIGTDQGNY